MILRADGKFSVIDPEWKGRTAVCIATGPSLSIEQVELIRAAKVPTIVVNDAYRIAPFADVVYFADAKWWKWQQFPERIEAWRAFGGQKCSIENVSGQITEPVLHLLRNARNNFNGLSTDPGAICTGANSGYQAINIAALASARRIVLVGYDCRAVNGKDHYFGAHPDGSKPPYSAIKVNFGHLVEPSKALGLEILNATPESAIECFPKVDLAASLEPDPVGTVVPA